MDKVKEVFRDPPKVTSLKKNCQILENGETSPKRLLVLMKITLSDQYILNMFSMVEMINNYAFGDNITPRAPGERAVSYEILSWLSAIFVIRKYTDVFSGRGRRNFLTGGCFKVTCWNFKGNLPEFLYEILYSCLNLVFADLILCVDTFRGNFQRD
jgi:hypothetical protein